VYVRAPLGFERSFAVGVSAGTRIDVGVTVGWGADPGVIGPASTSAAAFVRADDACLDVAEREVAAGLVGTRSRSA
jgi:hypothetical protein